MQQGTIEKLFENKTKAGKTYWRVEIGGESYSVWDRELVTDVKIGDMVQFEGVQKGNFKNILKMQKVTQPSGSPASNGNRQDAIMMQTCLKVAGNIIANHPYPEDTMVKEKVFDAAFYAKYLFRGLIENIEQINEPVEPEPPDDGDLGPEPPPIDEVPF